MDHGYQNTGRTHVNYIFGFVVIKFCFVVLYNSNCHYYYFFYFFLLKTDLLTIYSLGQIHNWYHIRFATERHQCHRSPTLEASIPFNIQKMTLV